MASALESARGDGQAAVTPIELIYCAAGGARFEAIARKYGFSYGAQLPGTTYGSLRFADQAYDKPRKQAKKASDHISDPKECARAYASAYRKAVEDLRVAYMRALAEKRPYMATVLDLEHEDQFEDVMSWADEASRFVSEIIIIPKYNGAIARLPGAINGKSVRLGFSEPTTYGGTTVPYAEFAGLPVHILGGSPKAQHRAAQHLRPLSVDGNYAMKMAQYNQFFTSSPVRAKNKHWPRLNESAIGRIDGDANYLSFELSCMNIRAMWLDCCATLRFAVERDIPQITKIAHQYRNELGYVNAAALRVSIARRSLVVASHSGEVQREYTDTLVSPNSELIIGFCNYRACLDGWQTVYEIAVHRDHKGSHIGAGLLAAVPNPIRLKCTIDNPANAFYEAMGFRHVGKDKGKKRELNMWHRGFLPPAEGSMPLSVF